MTFTGRPNSPQEFAQLKQACIAKVHAYVDLAREKLRISIPYPEVTFNLRGTTAGRAWYAKNKIEFQPDYLFENPDDFLLNTTGHEVAHLIAFAKKHDIKPHGKEWTNIMWYFSLSATRCHSYDVVGSAHKVRGPVTQKTSEGIIKVSPGVKSIIFDEDYV